ncbi:MAG: LCP family protein [Clostridia bacterium]
MNEKDEMNPMDKESVTPEEPAVLSSVSEAGDAGVGETVAMDADDISEEAPFFEDEIVEPPKKSGKKKKKKKKSPKKKKKGKKKKNKFTTAVFVIVLVCLMFLFGWIGYVGAYIYPLLTGANDEDEVKAPITEEQKEAFASGELTILLMGSDFREGDTQSRSDTLMVAFVNLDQKQIRLLSMPRDTYVTIPTTGERTKINHSYAYGGVDLVKQTLESNFGIKCDYYMDVDFQGFIDVIDALGGITVDVPQDMYYPDEGIDLTAGVQQLDGNKALQFCRFRGDGQGDLGRIDRQQAFLVAMKEKMFSAGTLLKIPDICSAVMDNMQTDFTGTQILQILLQFKNGVDFQTYQPENTPDYIDEISYVFITDKGQSLIDALITFGEIPADIEATTDKIDITPDAEETETTETTEATEEG